MFPKTTKAPLTADRNTEEDDGFWPNLEFATHTISKHLITAVSGRIGGTVTAKRGPDYYRELQAKRKTGAGGRPKKSEAN